MQTRADIAHLGATGYELDTSAYSDGDKEDTCRQVEEYKQIEVLILNGDLYRTEDPHTSNFFGFMVISKDKSEAVLTAYRRIGSVNNEFKYLKASGLDESKAYSVTGYDTTFKGSTLMNVGLPAVFKKGDFMTLRYLFREVC